MNNFISEIYFLVPPKNGRSMTYLANNIKVLRQYANLSQQELGLAIGKTSSTISNYENAEHQLPPMKVITKLAEVFGVSAQQLLNEDLSHIEPVPILIDDAIIKAKQRLSSNLTILRAKKGKSLKKLGHLLGYSAATINAWERGDNYMTIDALIKVSTYFGVSIDDLLHADFAKESTVKSGSTIEIG